MAKIKGSCDVTPEQEALLNDYWLPEKNKEREEAGLDPVANVDAYADWLLYEAFSDYAGKTKDKKAEDVADKYAEADAAIQAQIDALLEP